jgi:hypothetical protein
LVLPPQCRSSAASTYAPPSAPSLPSAAASLSPGASLTYNVECTLDSENWMPLSQNNVIVAEGLSAASFFKFIGIVAAVRVNVTEWVSGSVTLDLAYP